MPETEAVEGKPVIPAFPIVDNINRFITCKPYQTSFYAEVKDIELDIDQLASDFKDEFPDIPGKLIDDYIFYTVKACKNLENDTIVQAFITNNIAKLRICDDEETNEIITLWDRNLL